MRRQTYQSPGTLMQFIRCAACSQRVAVAVEGTDQNIGVLCPNHKDEIDEITFLKSQLQNESNLAQDFRTENKQLTTDLSLKTREQNDLQAEIRTCNTLLNELESKLELVKKKLTNWTKLIKHA